MMVGVNRQTRGYEYYPITMKAEEWFENYSLLLLTH